MQTTSGLQGEMKEWRGRVNDTISLGQDLMSDIQSESDYPEDYLNNVSEKVILIRRQMSQMENLVPETNRNLSYWAKKAQLYQNLKVLSNVLEQYEAKMADVENNSSEEMKLYKSNLATHTESLSQLKVLAKETLLHPGAIVDPSNTIKSDLYQFCEHFEALESKFSQHYNLMARSNTSAESQVQAQKEDNWKVHQDRVEAISLWMEEVSGSILVTEDPPFGDLVNLESHVKESDALVEDIKTLQCKLEEVDDGGRKLIDQCSGDVKQQTTLMNELEAIKDKWKEVHTKSTAQNQRLKESLHRSRALFDCLDEIQSFVTQLRKDLPSEKTPPVKKATELSQRTFKLLHFKDKIEKKRLVLQDLVVLPDSCSVSARAKVSQVEKEWKEVCESVIENYHAMKVASSGKFHGLMAGFCLRRRTSIVFAGCNKGKEA